MSYLLSAEVALVTDTFSDLLSIAATGLALAFALGREGSRGERSRRVLPQGDGVKAIEADEHG
jgi:hypothetical protein